MPTPMRKSIIAIFFLLVAASLAADDYVLPVFAVRMPAGDGTGWSSEVYVTNTGSKEAMVIVGIFLRGRISDTPPCLPFVQPFVNVPPHRTILWRTEEISLGIGCPAFAAGGLTFHSELPVHITSRMVRHEMIEGILPSPLSGVGQEIDTVDLLDLPKGVRRMILPSVGWHPNACGPSKLDTNVFFTNPGPSPVRIEIDATGQPGAPDLMIDGQVILNGPYAFELAPFSQRVLRLARLGPPIAVCLDPVVGAFTFTTSGPVSAIASIIDRRSGDPRTAPAIPIE